MTRATQLKVLAAAAMLALAGWLLVRFLRDARGGSDLAFFYDLSEQKLFTAPRTAVPPIRGLNDEQADAVRAVVISTNGAPRAKSGRRIAYLEMYSPELKRQMEAAQRFGASPEMGRGLAQAHRFVRRPTDSEWFPMNSAEAERIVSEWLAAGVDGGPALICTP